MTFKIINFPDGFTSSTMPIGETILTDSLYDQPNGIPQLDGTGKIKSAQLPSYVDDVIEYADTVSFPVTGETGKIYIALNTNKTYRWSGSTYIEISPSEVRSVNARTGDIVLDKTDVGLNNVQNLDQTNPANITQSASYRFVTDTEKSVWDSKENGIASGTTSQYWRGDKTFQNLDKNAVELGNVDNTSDATKNSASASLTNKTIDADLNTITNIENADIKANAGIDATKIADGSVTNTEFQYLDATSSIQTQLNNKASSTDLSTHTGATSAHGVTGNIVGTTDTQNISNKTFLDEIRVSEIASPATPAAGVVKIYAKSDKKIYKKDSDGVESEVGSGGGTGSLNTIFQLKGEELLGTWTNGNNATFLTAGTFSGAFAYDSLTPLHGTQSYKYTQAAGSLNDWIASPAQNVDLRFRGQQVYLTFPYKYDGNNSDIQIIVYDVTNSAIINTNTFVIGTNGSISQAVVGLIIPLTCTSIKIGFHVKVLNSGKILAFDDVQLSTDVYATTDVANLTDWASYTPTFTGFGTVSGVNAQWRQVGQNIELFLRFTSGTSTATEARISLPNNFTSADSTKILTLQSVGMAITSNVSANILPILIEPSVQYVTFGVQGPSANGLQKATANNIASSGVSLSITATIPLKNLSSYNASAVLPNQQVSSDTISFVFKSTAIDPNTDAIGTFNTYTYASSSNTATIAITAPTQSLSSMNVNGIQVFSRPFNTASTTASPARVDVFIGKGLKSKQVDAYVSTGKVTAISTDFLVNGTTEEYGTRVTYDETKGILSLDAGITISGAITLKRVGLDIVNNIAPTSGYFVFNASKSPSISAMPNMQLRIATITDVKSSGTAGGTASASTTQTRTLNTLVDNTGIVTSLVSNQFTLAAGTYYIEASAPAYRVAQHKIRIRNITDSTTALIGQSVYADAGGIVYNTSTATGEITITSSKTFELQHFTTSSSATQGLGVPTSNGENEVYSCVKITKIK